MTRVEEAVLAFMGAAEIDGKPWFWADFSADVRVSALLREDMAEVVGGRLLVTSAGWRYLDGRPRHDLPDGFVGVAAEDVQPGDIVLADLAGVLGRDGEA